MNLHELQTAFVATMRGGEPLADLEAAVLAGGLSVAERLAIYRNNHRLTLAGALASAYPVLERLLGCTSFAQLAARYVAQTPSASGDLHGYGACFGAFLDDFAPLADWPWHADLARLEWAVHEAYYAADADTVLSLAELAAAAVVLLDAAHEEFDEAARVGAHARTDEDDRVRERRIRLLDASRERIRGERQMLAVGRALMGQPDLLMLDEPSLGLAPLVVREIFRIIERLREQGVSILLIEQNARAALEVANHGYVLETGAIALEGPATDLAVDPRVIETYLGAARKAQA